MEEEKKKEMNPSKVCATVWCLCAVQINKQNQNKTNQYRYTSCRQCTEILGNDDTILHYFLPFSASAVPTDVCIDILAHLFILLQLGVVDLSDLWQLGSVVRVLGRVVYSGTSWGGCRCSCSSWSAALFWSTHALRQQHIVQAHQLWVRWLLLLGTTDTQNCRGTGLEVSDKGSYLQHGISFGRFVSCSRTWSADNLLADITNTAWQLCVCVVIGHSCSSVLCCGSVHVCM